MAYLVHLQLKTSNCFESEQWNWDYVMMFNRPRSYAERLNKMTSMEGHSATAKPGFRASLPTLPNTHHASYLLKWTMLMVPPPCTIHRDSPGRVCRSASFSSLIQIQHSCTAHAFETLQGKSLPTEINKQMILNLMLLSHYDKCTIWAPLPTSQPHISRTVSPLSLCLHTLSPSDPNPFITNINMPYRISHRYQFI